MTVTLVTGASSGFGRSTVETLARRGHQVWAGLRDLGGRNEKAAAELTALGSLTEAWHHELAPFGVESVIVDAAPYPTNIGANAVLPADTARMGAYGDGFGRFVADLTALQTRAPEDPREVSDAIVALIELPDGERPLRTVVAPAPQREAVEALNAAATGAARTVGAHMGVSAFLAL